MLSQDVFEGRIKVMDALWERTDKDMTTEQTGTITAFMCQTLADVDLLEVRPGEFIRGFTHFSTRAIALGTYLGPLVVYEVPAVKHTGILAEWRVADIAFMVTTQLARSGLFRTRYEGDQFAYAIERHFGLANNRNLHERLQVLYQDLQNGASKWKT